MVARTPVLNLLWILLSKFYLRYVKRVCNCRYRFVAVQCTVGGMYFVYIRFGINGRNLKCAVRLIWHLLRMLGYMKSRDTFVQLFSSLGFAAVVGVSLSGGTLCLGRICGVDCVSWLWYHWQVCDGYTLPKTGHNWLFILFPVVSFSTSGPSLVWFSEGYHADHNKFKK